MHHFHQPMISYIFALPILNFLCHNGFRSCSGPDGAGVAAGSGLGEREGGQHLSRGQLGQILRLLILVSRHQHAL